jgi:hypothetical protein
MEIQITFVRGITVLADTCMKSKQIQAENGAYFMGKLHSVESAAEFLGGLSPWTIRAWLSQGKLTRVKVGSRTMVLEQELIGLARPETPAQAAVRNIASEAGHKHRRGTGTQRPNAVVAK